MEIIRFMQMIYISSKTYEFKFRLYNESHSGTPKFRIESSPENSDVDIIVRYVH